MAVSFCPAKHHEILTEDSNRRDYCAGSYDLPPINIWGRFRSCLLPRIHPICDSHQKRGVVAKGMT